jgi:hypothetical protein
VEPLEVVAPRVVVLAEVPAGHQVLRDRPVRVGDHAQEGLVRRVGACRQGIVGCLARHLKGASPKALSRANQKANMKKARKNGPEKYLAAVVGVPLVALRGELPRAPRPVG